MKEKNTTKESKLEKYRKISEAVKILAEKHQESLTDETKKYLKERGITEEVFTAHKVGEFIDKGKRWISIPVADRNGLYTAIRMRIHPTEKDQSTKYRAYGTMKRKDTLYGWYEGYEPKGDVFITEGELDALAIRSKGGMALSVVTGGSTGIESFLPDLKGFNRVFVCYDNDKTGKSGQQKNVEALLEIEHIDEVYRVILPDSVGEKGDISDYFVKELGTLDDLKTKCAQKLSGHDRYGNAFVSQDLKVITHEEWKTVIEENFPNFVDTADAVLNLFLQLLIKDVTNPFSLIIVGQPSSGKTINLNFFGGVNKKVHESDTFTKQAFVSNISSKTKGELEETDLLPRLKNKVWLLKDLAPTFSKSEEELRGIIGCLTRLLDGEGYKTESGTHGSRGYEGEHMFMMAAATTPIPKRVWDISATLGARFLYWGMPDEEETLEDQVAMALGVSSKQKENACRDATERLVSTYYLKNPGGIKWNKKKDSVEAIKIASSMATLVAFLRGHIQSSDFNVYGENNHKHVTVTKEKSPRINTQLCNFIRAEAAKQGRNYVIAEDLKLLPHLVRSSVPEYRYNAFLAVLKKGGKCKVEQLEKDLDRSSQTVRKYMYELAALEVCDYVSGDATPVKKGSRETAHVILSKYFRNSFEKGYYDLLLEDGKPQGDNVTSQDE